MNATVELSWSTAAVVAAGYAVTLALSGVLVRHFTGHRRPAPPEPEPAGGARRYDAGAVIGKCENLLTLTFVLMDQITGLSLLLAAKSIVRKEKIEQDASYYLGGMLVNLVWSLLMGYAILLALRLVSA